MDKSDLHQAVKWAPGAAFALALGIAALGGESVRKMIWCEATAAFQDHASQVAMAACLVLYAVVWYISRPKAKPEPESEKFTQNHSGSGDNNMTF